MINTEFSRPNLVALYTFFGNGIKLASGPLILLAISSELSAEEIGFYYIFLSIVALKSLLELGITTVLKQHIVHEEDNHSKISELINFNYHWFAILSLLFLVFCFLLSRYLFFDYSGEIEWKMPWIATSLISSVSLLLMSLHVISDSAGQQVLLRRSIAISSVGYCFVLLISLINGLGLYSIPMAILVSEIFFAYLLRGIFLESKIHIKSEPKNLIKIFNEIRPLLSKVAIVWFVGYFYWNGFNLISFKFLGPEAAGLILFSIALVKSVNDICASLVISQMTIYSEYIAKKDVNKAFSIFKKTVLIGFTLLMCGYVFILLARWRLPEFYLFEKLIDATNICQLILFFITVYFITCSNNFVRCFKIEPFVYLSTFNAITVPGAFFYSLFTNQNNIFLLSTYFSFVALLVSSYILFSRLKFYEKI
jgi:hypothetical protein